MHSFAANAPTLPPLSRRAPRITVVARDERTTLAAVLGWDGARWRALAAADRGNAGTLAEDLTALADGLGRALGGARPPRDAAFLWTQVTAAVVEVPATEGLGAERLEGLLGWELEPFLPGEHAAPGANGAGGAAPVACGWARANGAGPLFACGLRPEVRDQAREAFSRAGLRLRGLYPLLGCAAAELDPGAAGARVVLEVTSGSVAATRVEGDRVTRTRLARCAPGGEVAAALGLVPEDAGLVLASPRSEDLRATLGEEVPLLEAPPEAPSLPSGLLGAARHALGLPGGERIAAVPPQTRRRLRLRGPVLIGGLVGLLVLSAIGLVEVGLAGALERARVRAAELRAASGAAAPDKATLEKRLKAARDRQEITRELRGRHGLLPAVLRALAESAPEELMVERLAEEPDGRLRFEGTALDEPAIQRLAAALAPRLALHGLQVGQPEVHRKVEAGAVLYTFTLGCTRGAAR